VKIGIDARFLTHPQKGGFKTYTEQLVAALAEIDAENEYILYLDRPPTEWTRLPNRPNFSSRTVPGLLPVFGMAWREQVGLARQVARDYLNLLHSPSLTAPLYLACPSVVTIHDVIWLFPETFSNGKPPPVSRKMMEWYYRVVPRQAARNASAILTVSEAAKASIVECLKLSADRVFVTPEAASPIYRPVNGAPQTETLGKFNLPAEFILAIGSADPRKNIATLLEAYARLPLDLRAKHKLAIVWTHDLLEAEMAKQVVKLGLTDQVHFLQGVTDDDLVLLYNAAALFVFPSLYEGFGLPLLEAMACGTPVIAGNNSSIPEIAGNAAILIEAQDARVLACAMTRVLTDEAIYAALKRKGLEQAAGFSWGKCAHQTLAAYRQALTLF
jgi:glycosyltransferase involved in cell wall biosynthesis